MSLLLSSVLPSSLISCAATSIAARMPSKMRLGVVNALPMARMPLPSAMTTSVKVPPVSTEIRNVMLRNAPSAQGRERHDEAGIACFHSRRRHVGSGGKEQCVGFVGRQPEALTRGAERSMSVEVSGVGDDAPPRDRFAQACTHVGVVLEMRMRVGDFVLDD